MATINSVLKLKANFKTGEFEAEGPVEVVNQRFQEFKDALQTTSQNRPNKAPANPSGLPEVPLKTDPPSAEPDPLLGQIFARARTGSGLELRIPPGGENGYWKVANAALLLLYGFSQVLGEHEVSAVALASGLRGSAIDTSNFHRPIGLLKDGMLITSQGARRSTRYKLTTKGINTSKKFISELLNKLGAANDAYEPGGDILEGL